MSRLEKECVMYIGRNRSGIDSGELDYGVMVEKFEEVKLRDLPEVVRLLEILKEKCIQRMEKIENEKN